MVEGALVVGRVCRLPGDTDMVPPDACFAATVSGESEDRPWNRCGPIPRGRASCLASRRLCVLAPHTPLCRCSRGPRKAWRRD